MFQAPKDTFIGAGIGAVFGYYPYARFMQRQQTIPAVCSLGIVGLSCGMAYSVYAHTVSIYYE